MGKLSTWLVVALTGGAFAVGITGGALVAGGGGGSQSHPTLTVSTPATTSPPAVASESAPAKKTRLSARAVSAPSAQTKTSTTVAALRTITTPPAPRPTVVRLPEENPLAATTAPSSGAAPAVAQPASPPDTPAPPVTPTPAPSAREQPTTVEPSDRRAIAGAALSGLQAATADEGETLPANKVLQGLEKCLELVATGSLPPGLEAAGCLAS